MNDSTARILNLSPQKRALLLQRLQKGKTNLSEQIPVRKDRSALTAASFAQQRLWFLNQLTADPASYNIVEGVQLTGPLNLEALNISLHQIVQRHETLRTTFQQHENELLQQIHATLPLPFLLIDLQSLSTQDCEQAIAQLTQQESHAPFDLSHGPLLRVRILRLAPQKHQLLFAMHHIASDGWSMDIFMHELSLLYTAQVNGHAASMPDLPVQYADYALWQRQWLQGPALQQQLDYWKHQLADAPALLELPYDHPLPSQQQGQGALHQFSIPLHRVQALQHFARQHGCTPFMLFLAAFQVLLHRYSRQHDLVIGTPVANRNRPEVANLIGFFVNTLALRLDLSADPSFQSLLQQVKTITLEAYEHQDLPFDQLVETLQPQRMLNHSPLFQVMFVLQTQPTTNLALTDIRSQRMQINTNTTKFDLSLIIVEEPDAFQAFLEYRTDLFEAATMQRLGSYYQTLLDDIVAHPDRPISQLNILPEQEQLQLLNEWNVTTLQSPLAFCLHELIEQQVARTPEAIALVFEGEGKTYRELNNAANLLAHSLRTMGIGPGALVGVSMERSLELAVSMLAILKAGGAYVPLDAAYPEERLTYMIEDAQLQLLLTQSSLQHRLPTTTTPILVPDIDWQTPHDNLINLSCPEHPIYMIYTSGSTGRPKGAVIAHQNFINLLQWFVSAIHISSHDHILIVTSFSFDLTQKNLFAPLLTGGTVHLLPSHYYDPAAIRRTIAEQAITLLNCTPSMFYPLLEETPLTSLMSLRAVVLGGEPIHISRLQPLFQGPLQQTALVNYYGPTECSDAVAFTYVNYAQLVDPPIGRPINNTQLYILDDWLRPVPIGAVGELYVGGNGLGYGYLNRPELTAERFIPHPFSQKPGARLYRTGDLVRYQSDGAIVFLGRKDQQVKLRGFRIELGEIEAILQQLPSIRQAVVVLREDVPDHQQLVAYLVGENTDSAVIHRVLSTQLPEYMVPSAFVFLDHLPLSPNGKLDRRQLPAPDLSTQIHDDAFVAPRSPIELTLASIWADVLALPSNRSALAPTSFPWAATRCS
ncbi:non-ribosomal peptide synthetase [Ktedonobacter robiniae]|uniref:Non-ribosomal peptide synthetase n=1 Tax=Ktedonobacter robiniae TaxID=2778365 RepID=A0ABQ3UX96_9CHLR|nr:amino acid adenylation domain-containing protein [Ktedonobacter robiniae]GHO57486.1 hypothetical protein KSB_59610 [Ktedonobacter robiniae]